MMDLRPFFFLIIFFSYASVNSQTKSQEPIPPFDYKVEDVKFFNQIDSIWLAGTLTIPKNTKNFPTVILISGSGPQNRDSEIFGHKPFFVMADHLTQNGIAVLRVDDRGTAKSEGNHNEAGLHNFVRDIESSLAFLKARKDIDKQKIGLAGHSLGGVIAPIVASRNNDIAFVVMLAGSGIPGDKLMLLQKEKVERQMGVADAAIEVGQKNIGGSYDIILDESIPQDSLQSKLKDYFKTVFIGMLPENQLTALSSQLSVPWLVDFIRYDPAESLSKINCPVLAINGSKDLQVPADENLFAIDSILKNSGNQKVTVKEMEGLNHLFQESETGLPQEYAKIEQTFSPKALQLVTGWIKNIDNY